MFRCGFDSRQVHSSVIEESVNVPNWESLFDRVQVLLAST
jgi:hypothetical protein